MYYRSLGRTAKYCSLECKEAVVTASEYRRMLAYNMKESGKSLKEIGEALSILPSRVNVLVWLGLCLVKREQGFIYCLSCGGQGSRIMRGAVLESTCITCKGIGWIKRIIESKKNDRI